MQALEFRAGPYCRCFALLDALGSPKLVLAVRCMGLNQASALTVGPSCLVPPRVVQSPEFGAIRGSDCG